MGQGDHSSWTRDARFKPLLEALQETIDRQAREKAKFPGDHPEYNRGFIDGLIRAKGMAGYYSQYSLEEEAEIRAMMESPEAKTEMAQAEARLASGDVRSAEEVRLLGSPEAKREMVQAEARLAAGDVRSGEEVRAEQGSRIRSRLEIASQAAQKKPTSAIRERLEPSAESTDEPAIDG